MIYLRLFYEFFKVGLFSVGGGLATIPFLATLAEKSGWYTLAELADMVAVAESTPGPIGVNVATYVGFRTCGIAGSVISTIGLVTPSFIVMFIIAIFLDKFKNSKTVNDAFYGIRPASMGLITAALYSLISMSMFSAGIVNFKMIILAAVIFVLSNYVPKIKKMHPVLFILLGAVIGVIFAL